jgi:hypothetical protein
MATKALKAVPTVADELKAMDKRRAENLRVWNALSRTDPAHTKQFSRAGGFKGTAIKPIWIVHRLTEQFGPCGEGWGIGEPRFETVPADEEILVYCTVECWHGSPENKIYGVGGDKVRVKRQSGAFCDDEAFKKAFTDAVGNAFKFVGVGADVHMGLFEDSKYLAEVTAEFHPKPDPTTGEPKPRGPVKLAGPYTSPTQLKAAAKAFAATLENIGDADELEAWEQTPDYAEFVAQCERDMPSWWFGGEEMPAEFVPLAIRVANKRRELEELESIRS